MSKKRVILWSFGVLLGIIIIAIVAVFFIIRSQSFHHYVIAKVVDKTQEATGGRVEIGGYDFDMSRLRAVVHDITIHGTESDPATPLATADNVTVGLKIVSLMQQKVDLS